MTSESLLMRTLSPTFSAGLEHLELLAFLEKMNIVVVNAVTHQSIRFLNHDGQINRCVLFNGANHWSQISFAETQLAVRHPAHVGVCVIILSQVQFS